MTSILCMMQAKYLRSVGERRVIPVSDGRGFVVADTGSDGLRGSWIVGYKWSLLTKASS